LYSKASLKYVWANWCWSYTKAALWFIICSKHGLERVSVGLKIREMLDNSKSNGGKFSGMFVSLVLIRCSFIVLTVFSSSFRSPLHLFMCFFHVYPKLCQFHVLPFIFPTRKLLNRITPLPIDSHSLQLFSMSPGLCKLLSLFPKPLTSPHCDGDCVPELCPKNSLA